MAKSQFILDMLGELGKVFYPERKQALQLSEKTCELDCLGFNPISTATYFPELIDVSLLDTFNYNMKG